MRERLYRVEAIVLKRTDVGEADRLLTLLTLERGKIRAVAKGARKPSSRKSGHVELFAHTELLLAKGRQSDIVTQAETRHAFTSFRDDLDRLGYAYYLAELVDKFTEEESENRSLFYLLLSVLDWLGDPTTDVPLLTRFFELRLMENVGYRPELRKCVSCGSELEAVENYSSAEAGGVLDPNCVHTQREKIPGQAQDAKPISLNALKTLRYLQTREWETVRTLQLGVPVQIEVEAILYRHIVYHLERNLKSVEFLRELRREI